MVAIVLVRGLINIRHDIKKTIDSLSLRRNNVCVVRKETAELKGMLAKAKDYITWGDIDSETYKLLLEKKGKKSSSADDKANGKGVKQYFNMNPPRKGYGRKGIKNSFNKGGALGYRGNKINDLIRRML
ncbi:uL30 family ribosomal protein [Candidatus Woesearchaeota archaeon]|nr:uL30 family ribosomal protein [Candidatus Woesearchaeota archaeon]